MKNAELRRWAIAAECRVADGDPDAGCRTWDAISPYLRGRSPRREWLAAAHDARVALGRWGSAAEVARLYGAFGEFVALREGRLPV